MGVIEKTLEIGARYRTPSLLAQADYFAGLLTEDADLVTKFGWTTKRTEDLSTIRAEVARHFADKHLAKEDTIASTVERNSQVGEAKVWVSQLVQMIANAFELDEERQDDFRPRETLGRAIPRVIARMETLLPVAKKHVDALEEWGLTSEFLAMGERTLSALKKAQKTQEVKIQDLPSRTRDFYQAKGEMYLAIKRAQRCARATFKREPAKAARYSLEILYRQTQAPSRQKKAAPATTTTV